MIKRALCVLIALLALVSMLCVCTLSASAEEVSDTLATADEASKDETAKDEAELKISDEPKVEKSSVNGTVIGYIGDASLDDKVNVKDATAIQKHLAKLINLSEQAKHLGDADNNEKLNVRDATTVQKYIAGFEVESKIWHLLYETGTHAHNFVESIFEATCMEDGYTSYSCICGDEYTENIVPAMGHSYKARVVEPTCVSEGYTVYRCVCGDKYTDDFTAKTPHSYSAKVIKPTCEAEGYTIFTCTCGDSYTGNVTDKAPHDYSSKVVKPTCAQGYTLNECNNCGYKEKINMVDATKAHNYNSYGVCSACKITEGAFESLRSYIVDNGFYDMDSSIYYVYLPTGYEVDIGTLAYDELDDKIFIGYNLLVEDGVSKGDVGFTKDTPFYSFRVSYPGTFSTYGPDNFKSKYTLAEPNFDTVKYFNYSDSEIDEDICLQYSIDMINAALAIYSYYEDELPVTLSELGFTSFEIN